MKQNKCSKEHRLLTIVREFLRPTKVGGSPPPAEKVLNWKRDGWVGNIYLDGTETSYHSDLTIRLDYYDRMNDVLLSVTKTSPSVVSSLYTLEFQNADERLHNYIKTILDEKYDRVQDIKKLIITGESNYNPITTSLETEEYLNIICIEGGVL